MQATLGLLVVGEDQLGLDRLDVGERVDAAVGVGDPGVEAVAADDVADRVGLADRGEELVAEALALRGALDEAGDVVEGDRRRHQLGAADGLPDLLEALVGDPGDRDVGLDRRERVVAGLGAALGQGVEERRLARVGQPDYPHLHRESGTTSPRTTPRTRPGEDVRGVVHAEVRPAQGEGGGEQEGEGGERVDPRHRRRHREGGGRVRRGEAERAGRAAERRQALAPQIRAGAPDQQLDDVVEADRDRAEGGADQPRFAPAGVGEGEEDAERQPDGAVVAGLAEQPRRALEAGRVPAGAHRAQEAEVCVLHGGAG